MRISIDGRRGLLTLFSVVRHRVLQKWEEGFEGVEEFDI
jgi:hypothetical protein